MFVGTLKKHPEADLGPILAKYNAEYGPRRQRKLRQRAELKHEEKLKEPNGQSSHQFRSIHELTRADGPKSKSAESKATHPLFTSSAPVSVRSRELKQALSIPENQAIQIIRPLSHRLDDDLGSPPLHTRVRSLLNSAKVLYSFGIVHVLKLSDNVVVKIRPLDRQQAPPENELDVLSYLRSRLPDLPIPEPLGLLQIGETCYSFMSYLPGQEGSSTWLTLTNTQKDRFRSDLALQLSRLRSLSNDTGSFGFNGVCVDLRRLSNTTNSRITTFQGFLSYLLEEPYRPIAAEYFEYLKHCVFKSELQGTADDLIFTHADLHPRNFLIGTDGEITGIIDWETAGWYPWYWEGVKALNTISFGKKENMNDWWRILPEGVLDGPIWAADNLISKVTGRG
ncbi:kinase-like domain-containing protein [Geopyxis carbonaria]|nr:kinase-like domain-containing protein [Geopyxis carbonaria]